MSAERLAILADRTPNAVMLSDAGGRVQWLNRTASTLIRLSSADAAGLTLDVVLGRLGLDAERQRYIRKSAEGQTSFAFKVQLTPAHAWRSGFRRIVVPDEAPPRDETGPQWFFVHVEPLVENDALTGWLVVGNDVTELKQVQEGVNRRTRQALRFKSALLELAQSDMTDYLATLRRVTETCTRVLELERASVWSLETNPEAIRCQDLFCASTVAHHDGTVRPSEHYPAYFAELRAHRAIAADDAQGDPRTSDFTDTYLRPLDIRSMLDVPIWVGGVPAGVLCLEQVGNSRHWTDEDCAFAQGVADIVSIAIQTAKRHRAEMELMAERDQSRRLIAAAPIVICGTSPDGLLTFINPAGEHITGYAAHELVGQNWASIFYSGADYDTVQDALRSLPEHEFRDLQVQLRTSSGELKTISWDTVNRWDEHGTLVEVTAFGRDVTLRHHMEEQQRVARDAAEAASRLKSEFLATVSHEIRTPLNGVIGMAGLLLDTALTDDQRDYAETVRRSAESLLTIINDILDFSKVEAGKLTLEEIDFDLHTVMDEAAAGVAEAAYAKGLEISCVPARNLPLWVRSDPGRLRQVLSNLLSNAVKFTERGEIVVRASVSDDSPAAQTLRFDVVDTGIGLSADQQLRLFQPFSQGDGSTTRRYGGTGLGLAICKRLVAMLGGDIGVSSVPGRGSTFWFTVRVNRAAQKDLLRLADPGLQHLQALVVMRACTSRSVLVDTLESWDVAVATVDTADEALRHLHRAAGAGRSCDLVLTDEAALRTGSCDLPSALAVDPALSRAKVIVIAAPGLAGAADVGGPGVHALLLKPIRHSQLAGCLRSVLGPVSSSSPCSAKATGSAVVQAPAHILVAEDNLVNQKVAVKLLEKIGHRVDVAANGREAVEAVARVHYALVFMDCQMPEVDGFEATRLIRAHEGEASHAGHLPIVAMTVNALKGDRERCLAAGMDDYIAKPISREGLEAVLGRWLGHEGHEGHAGHEEREGHVPNTEHRTLTRTGNSEPGTRNRDDSRTPEAPDTPPASLRMNSSRCGRWGSAGRRRRRLRSAPAGRRA